MPGYGYVKESNYNEVKLRLESALDALEKCYCRCECSTHGSGCGVSEATCRLKAVCNRCMVLRKNGRQSS